MHLKLSPELTQKVNSGVKCILLFSIPAKLIDTNFVHKRVQWIEKSQTGNEVKQQKNQQSMASLMIAVLVAQMF